MSAQSAPGGMITYADLLELANNSKELGNSVQAWNDIVQGIEVNVADLDERVQAPLSGSWHGVASDHANKGRSDFPANWNPNDIQIGWDIHVPSISVHAPIPPVPAIATSDDESDD